MRRRKRPQHTHLLLLPAQLTTGLFQLVGPFAEGEVSGDVLGLQLNQDLGEGGRGLAFIQLSSAFNQLS